MAEEKEKAKAIDINDLSLTDEALEIDPTADPFQLPPPPPDGTYRLKLSVAESGWTENRDKRGKVFRTVNIEARVVDEGGLHDNAVFFDNCTSIVFEGSRTSRMAGVLAALGHPVAPRTMLNEMARALDGLLKGEPQCLGDTQWEAYCRDCQKTILRSMKRFPPTANGQGHKHVVECSRCGSEVAAQGKITRFRPLA